MEYSSKIAKDLQIVCSCFLCKTIDQLAIANSVRWYCHVLRREDGHVWRRALGLRLNFNGRKGG